MEKSLGQIAYEAHEAEAVRRASLNVPSRKYVARPYDSLLFSTRQAWDRVASAVKSAIRASPGAIGEPRQQILNVRTGESAVLIDVKDEDGEAIVVAELPCGSRVGWRTTSVLLAINARLENPDG